MTIAHRQAISALRGSVRAKSKDPGLTLDDVAENQALTEAGPGALLDDLEQLDTLRKLVNDLPEDERLLFTELDAIINRRWVDAAASLGLSESTVRSKWKRVLEHLRGAFGG
jgi:DNA-directed RNA polymerase specialized sigma24 family protein